MIARKFAQQSGEARAFLRSHAGKRFIEQQHLRLHRKCDTELKLPQLSVAQRSHDAVDNVRQADTCQRGMRHCDGRIIVSQRAPQSSRRHRKPRIFQHRQLRHQIAALERAPDTTASDAPVAPSGDVVSADNDAAGRRREFAGKQVDQRALARAVRADHRMKLTDRKLQRHVRHSEQSAEPARYADRTQQRGHGRKRNPARPRRSSSTAARMTRPSTSRGRSVMRLPSSPISV